MIDQKDIDRLLAGRKIIDGIKKPDSETLNTLHATAKISTKETVTTADKADAVVVREEIATLLETEKQSILDAEKALAELGFAGIGDFMDWNRTTAYNYFVQCHSYTGECDLCKDYKGDAPCQLLYSDASCFVKKVKPPENQIWNYFIMKIGGKTELTCPKLSLAETTKPLILWTELLGRR